MHSLQMRKIISVVAFMPLFVLKEKSLQTDTPGKRDTSSRKIERINCNFFCKKV